MIGERGQDIFTSSAISFFTLWLSCLPQTMEVAIFPRRNLGGVHCKDGFRDIPWFEKMPVCLAVGNDLDPFDIVFVFHGMGNAPHLHLHAARYFLDNRHMLFF